MARNQDPDEPPSPGRGVLAGAFDLLRAVPGSAGQHQVRTLSRRTGIPRPTVHRLLAQLAEVGVVRRDRDDWVLSESLVRLGRQVEPVRGLRDAAGGVLHALREQTGTSLTLATADRSGYTGLVTVPGRGSPPFVVSDGYEMARDSAAARLLSSPTPIRPAASVLDDEEVMPGLSCLAVPVSLGGGRNAALQLSAHTGPPAHAYATLLRHSAHLIRTNLPAPDPVGEGIPGSGASPPDARAR